MGRVIATTVILLAVGCSDDQGGTLTPSTTPPVETCQLPEIGRVEFGHSDSLDDARAIVEGGGLLRGRDFTVAGVYAEHDTPFPNPCCEGPLCLHAELGIVPDVETGAPIRVVRVGVNAADRSAEPVDVRRNVVVTVDLSASLRTPKSTTLIRQLLDEMIDGLHVDDQFSLVTFRNQPNLNVPLTRVGNDRTSLHAAVEALEFGGATNLWGGLEGALFHAVTNFDSTRENRVILITDGRPTWGVSNADVVVDQTYDFVRRGIMLSIVGIGEDQADTITRRVGTEADGEFFAIDDESAVTSFVEGQLTSTWRALASDVAIEVTKTGPFAVDAVYGVDDSGWNGEHIRIERPVLLETPDGRIRSPGHGVGGGSMVTFQFSSGLAANERLFTARLTYERGTERFNQTVDVTVDFDTAGLKRDVYFATDEMEKAMIVHDTAVRMFLAGLRSDAQEHEASLEKLKYAQLRLEAYLGKRGGSDDLNLTLALIRDAIDVYEERGVEASVRVQRDPWPDSPTGSNP